MLSPNNNSLIREADTLIDNAVHEMEHAKEDVNAYMVCYNSRQALVNYLIAYLSVNQIEIEKPVTVASLLKQCSAVDSRFDLMNLDSFNCRHEVESESYCLDVDTVGECLRIAKQAQGLIKDDAPPY